MTMTTSTSIKLNEKNCVAYIKENIDLEELIIDNHVSIGKNDSYASIFRKKLNCN